MIDAISKQKNGIENLRASVGASDLIAQPEDSILKKTKRILERLNSRSENFSSTQVSGLATVVVDVTVLFTSRDWGVAGTMSTIGGGLAMSATE